jgi:inositol phosphorylceramide mannosyltransferase catalytic subunit
VIPRILHHIWIGPDPLPDDQRPWIKSWKRKHPTWEHRLWTEEDLPEDPIRPEILERLRAPVERADILRLEILYRHGGVYLDTDLECLRPLDDVLADEEFVGVCHKPGRITNTAIAAVPGHPLLERALSEVRPMEMYWTSASERLKEVAGPLLLDRLVGDFPDVKLLEPPVFFPSTPEEREDAVAVHHMARVWHNTTTLRAAMLRAETRLERTREKLEEEKRAHATTKKRLAKLEGGGKRRAGKERAPDDEVAQEERPEEPRASKRERREKRAWLRRSE